MHSHVCCENTEFWCSPPMQVRVPTIASCRRPTTIIEPESNAIWWSDSLNRPLPGTAAAGLLLRLGQGTHLGRCRLLLRWPLHHRRCRLLLPGSAAWQPI